MRLFDQSTMPLEQAIRWDPESILGRAIAQQRWTGVSDLEKRIWLRKLNDPNNDDTFMVKLLDYQAILMVIIKGTEVRAKFVMLHNFEDFVQGPIFEGPYNWPLRN